MPPSEQPYELSWRGTLSAAALNVPPSVLQRVLGGRHEVDGRTLQPATQMLLLLAEKLGLDGHIDDVTARRKQIRRSAALVMPRARRVSVTDTTLPGAAGTLSARRYRPWDSGSAREPTILYLHGGGWVVGDLDTHDPLCRAIAVASQCNVIALDYRLAPEFPYPAALDDAVAAFRHLRDHPTADGVPGAVAVMGDSAGGNLAAALALRLRDAGEAGPLALGLLYPVTDLRMGQPSIDRFAEGYFLTKADMEFYRHHYAPAPEQWQDPCVSPLLAADLSGLPPTWIWTAGFDPLRDEGDRLAERLAAAGNDGGHRCYDDQIHGVASMGILPGGMARTMDIGRQMGTMARALIAERKADADH